MIEKFPYVIGEPAEIFHNGEWKKGEITNGYRFQDGIVTIITEDGETVGCGEARKELYRPLGNKQFCERRWRNGEKLEKNERRFKK